MHAGATAVGRDRASEVARPGVVHPYYELDEDESKHLLGLEEYGHSDAPNAWLLLQQEQ